VRLFTCQSCKGVLFFENSRCMTCHQPTGYCAESAQLVQLPEAAPVQAAPMQTAPKASSLGNSAPSSPLSGAAGEPELTVDVTVPGGRREKVSIPWTAPGWAEPSTVPDGSWS
jgi:hypothetical protein